MDISSAITQHTVVLCVEKRERGIGLQTWLQKAGLRVHMALSLYDALKLVSQEMPHLVITEAALSDGSAVNVFDKLQAHETLKKTPILVYIQKKTKEELQAVAIRKFAGFYLGQLEPAAFLAKVNEVIKAHASVSPYFVAAADAGLATDVTIAIEATVVGRSGEQLISRSTTEVDPAASMVCVPTAPEFGPAVLRMASNLRQGDDVYNLFPINRIVGAGRKWVLGLPEIKLGEEKAQQSGNAPAHKVIFYEPSDQRFEGFKEILKGYGIELLHAKTLNAAAAILKRDSDSIGCVYLHELMNDASALEWKNVYSKLSASKRPPLIVGTLSMAARSTSAVRYIKRPFGMGLFVEMLNASFERPEKLAVQTTDRKGAGIAVRYQAPASLLGIDESGGVMQVRFPLLKGSRLIINHSFLVSVWEGNAVVQVSAVSPDPKQPELWHARFEAVTAGMSKVKYWDKVSKQLAQLAPVVKSA